MQSNAALLSDLLQHLIVSEASSVVLARPAGNAKGTTLTHIYDVFQQQPDTSTDVCKR